MPTTDYRLADGTRVTGTTTILKRVTPSGGLIHWAWTQGRDGKNLYETRDRAGDAGTLGHAMIEAYIHQRAVEGLESFDANLRELADKAFQAYLEWERSYDVQIQETEMHLVSEEFRYGGTPDAVGLVRGKLSLLDWKTSNALYPEVLGQLAAYGRLWFENRGQRFESYHVLRLGKEHGNFDHRYYPPSVVEGIGWRYFKAARDVYNCDRELKKAL